MKRLCQSTCDRHPFMSPPRTESSLSPPSGGSRRAISHRPTVKVRRADTTRKKQGTLETDNLVVVVVGWRWVCVGWVGCVVCVGCVVVCWWCGPVCGAHVSVDMSAQEAPNYGGRVPVDTTPDPAPVCRALKKSTHHSSC